MLFPIAGVSPTFWRVFPRCGCLISRTRELNHKRRYKMTVDGCDPDLVFRTTDKSNDIDGCFRIQKGKK
jgi:hypothetical protein